jgi:iron complex outermembrane recepter protein
MCDEGKGNEKKCGHRRATRTVRPDLVDCSGMTLVRAPEWTGTAGYERVFDVGGDSTLRADIDARFASSQYEEIYTGGGRYAFSRGVAAGGDPTLFYANIRAPRSYGLTIGKSF